MPSPSLPRMSAPSSCTTPGVSSRACELPPRARKLLSTEMRTRVAAEEHAPSSSHARNRKSSTCSSASPAAAAVVASHVGSRYEVYVTLRSAARALPAHRRWSPSCSVPCDGEAKMV